MGKYDDIYGLAYQKSKDRKQMTMQERAAQFSPFAALSGYEDAIEETARLTEVKIGLSEDEKREIGEKLSLIRDNLAHHPHVRIVFFVPDALKSGGRYVTAEGEVKKLREIENSILLSGGKEIRFEDILLIDIEKSRRMRFTGE